MVTQSSQSALRLVGTAAIVALVAPLALTASAQYGSTSTGPVVTTGPVFGTTSPTSTGGGGGGGGGGRSYGFYDGSFIPGARQTPSSYVPGGAMGQNTPMPSTKLRMNYGFDDNCLYVEFLDTQFETIHYRATRNLYCHDIIHGRADDHANMYTDTPIIRAEFMKVVARATEAQLYQWSLGSGFPDNGAEHWFSEYVDTMEMAGVINGYPDGYFRPGREIDFGEILKVVALAFSVPVDATVGSTWQDPYYVALSDMGVMPPELDGQSYGYVPTRGEAFELVDNMLNLLNTQYRGVQ